MTDIKTTRQYIPADNDDPKDVVWISGGTVYYGGPAVSSTSNDGSLAVAGDKVSLTSGKWVVSANLSRLDVRSILPTGPAARVLNFTASFTAAPEHMATMAVVTSSSAVTVTLPQDSDAAIPIGGWGTVASVGTGTTTFAAGTGATIDAESSYVALASQNSSATWMKIAASTYLLFGSLA